MHPRKALFLALTLTLIPSLQSKAILPVRPAPLIERTGPDNAYTVTAYNQPILGGGAQRAAITAATEFCQRTGKQFVPLSIVKFIVTPVFITPTGLEGFESTLSFPPVQATLSTGCALCNHIHAAGYRVVYQCLRPGEGARATPFAARPQSIIGTQIYGILDKQRTRFGVPE
jgi:hypothetical protein